MVILGLGVGQILSKVSFFQSILTPPIFFTIFYQKLNLPVNPSFFLQTPHRFFFGLLGLSLLVFLEPGVPSSSDQVEQTESSFLRFELDEGFGVTILV